MQQNLALAVEFFGSVAVNGVPSVMEGSLRLLQTKGGIISAGASQSTSGSAIFGCIMSVLASGTGADEAAFYVGYPSGTGFVVIGALLNEQGVRENDPAKPNWLFNEEPATVVIKGRLRYSSWGSSATSALATPIIGCRVVFNNGTGIINFLPAGTSVPAGYTQLQAAVVGIDQFTNMVDLDLLGPSAS
jgi:hypothetical protein